MREEEQRKEVLRDIIRQLHAGLSLAAAKERFETEVGDISPAEIAQIEQSLINEGMSPEEIKKFCNVHALLFESALAKTVTQVESPAHPVNLFKAENRKIEEITRAIKQMDKYQFLGALKIQLDKLKGIDIHYIRKEQLLFPFLEKYGFMGPSKVMWGKDNEIRGLLKEALIAAQKIENEKQFGEFITQKLNPLIEEVVGMIFKEENILLPTALEKLAPNDWVEILKDSATVGYVYIEKPKETSAMIDELKKVLIQEPEVKEGNLVCFPTGNLRLKELLSILNVLPVDLTFVDKNDEVRYFSDGKERAFIRTKAVIGRKVQNCHPPSSVDRVERILSAFKAGKEDAADFRINFKGKFISIRYFAVRDENRSYLGTLEVTQDITGIVGLKGEKRLLDEKIEIEGGLT